MYKPLEKLVKCLENREKLFSARVQIESIEIKIMAKKA